LFWNGKEMDVEKKQRRGKENEKQGR